MKKLLCAMFATLFILVLGACGNTESTQQSEQDIKEMVQEYSVGTHNDVSASITSEELIVTNDNGNETSYQLPEDEFFVSIAPFIDTTHDCAIHSLTGCQGELVEKEFDVYIEDVAGNTIVNETMSTFENGFIDLWLPRNKTLQVKIQHEGKITESEISTYEGDNTCITTMQLV